MTAPAMQYPSQSHAPRREALLLSLQASDDPARVGGKAVGLCRLIQHGFPVPDGLCLTVQAYQEILRSAGIDPDERWLSAQRDPTRREQILSECRSRITTFILPDEILETVLASLSAFATDPKPLWAIRSSATAEDAPMGSYAGLFTTVLGVPSADIAGAITRCWASLWTDAVFEYHGRRLPHPTPPSMAVIIQPMLTPQAAGVAYSCHPVSGRPDQVLINAVWGLAEPLVSGHTRPDQYTVHVGSSEDDARIIERAVAHKPTRMQLRSGRLTTEAVLPSDQDVPALRDAEALALAKLVRDVARELREPVDVEWALEERGYWLLQARPVSVRPADPILTDYSSVWSRANFKETLPELPSPLALSFLREYMEACILRHYLELGCTIPPGSSTVRILHGRPYINVSLFQSLVSQLGGNAALVIEQMGGDPSVPLPMVRRLPWWRFPAAGLRMQCRIRRAVRSAPAWFDEMRAMADHLTELTEARVPPVGPEAILAQLVEVGHRLHEGDLTFGIVAGVAQGLQALQLLLEWGIGRGWRPLLNASLQGLGTVISARQILLLHRLADIARQEPAVSAFFHAQPFASDGFRASLRGTRFLEAFDHYLAEYGHRAVGESDMMEPRFSEQPGYLLEIVRGHLLAPAHQSVEETQQCQVATRNDALQRIRCALRRRPPVWTIVRWWHCRLARSLALREENRHHLMYLAAAIRRVERHLGASLAAAGRLAAADDIFFLTAEELRGAFANLPRDYRAVVTVRRHERAACANLTVPDVVMPGGPQTLSTPADTGTLHGTPISTGIAEGPVRLVTGKADAAKVLRGDILVMPVIDPGMTPLLGLAAGIVVEMGGTLSHGAIIAREFGLPAIVNVPHATCCLQDGERVVVDATAGEVRRLAPPT